MLRIGRQVGGLAAMALGAVMLRWGEFTPWQKVPLDLPLRGKLAYAVAAILIATGAGLLVKRIAKPAAVVLAALFAVSALLKVLTIAQVPGRLQLLGQPRRTVRGHGGLPSRPSPA